MTNDMMQDDLFLNDGFAVPEIEDCAAETIPAGAVPEKKKTADVKKDVCVPDLPGTGPAVSLQKDKREVPAQGEKLLLPDVISMTKYFCDHYRLSMFSYLNRCLKDGSLEKVTRFPFQDLS